MTNLLDQEQLLDQVQEDEVTHEPWLPGAEAASK